MTVWDDTIGSISTGGGQTLWMIGFIIVIVILVILIIGGLFTWLFFKKRWNIKVEIKLTRSDGRITNAEWGKGFFNAKRGVCFVKRPGFRQRACPIKIFDIRKYIQGENVLTVIQTGPVDFIPVLNDSWEEYVEDKPMRDVDGKIVKDEEGNPVYERASILNIKVDTGLNKAWKTAWEAAAKRAYSLSTFFQQFQTPIAIAIVIIAVFVGFAILWTRLASVCG